MTRTQAVIVASAGAFLALVLVAFLGSRAPGPEGRMAPGFQLEASDGTTVTLAALRGRPVLVNFWATWCPPCVAETASLDRLSQDLKPSGLVVLGVSVDRSWEEVRRFADEYRVSFPLLLDSRAVTPRRYGTLKYPETYLVDAQGRLARKWIGAIDWADPAVRGEIARLALAGEAKLR